MTMSFSTCPLTAAMRSAADASSAPLNANKSDDIWYLRKKERKERKEEAEKGEEEEEGEEGEEGG